MLSLVVAVLAIQVLQQFDVTWLAQTYATEPAGSVTADAVGAASRGVGTVIAGVATLFIKLIGGILYFVLKWMGPLMDNTFILEGDIGEKIRAVWVIIRNFVNIFFALALVVVALLSVVGYGDEGGNYAMKKFIPRMALALIAVNFTFLACRLILDVNNVLTTAIFSIPQSVTTLADIGPSGFSGKTIFTKFSCLDDENINDASKRAEALEKQHGAIASLGGVCFAQDPGTVSTEELLSRGQQLLQSQSIIGATGQPNVSNQQAIVPVDQSLFTKKDFIWVMASQFQGIHNLNKVSVLLDPTFSGLTVNALFSVVFAVIYATAYISMFIILIARMAVLWVTIMLSPLIAINIVFPDLKFQDFDIKEKFLTHAFVPAKMAVPLALGYIMLSQMVLAVETDSAIFGQQKIDLAENGEFARGVSFTTLIYGAASVAVLWMGVFAASKGVIGEGLVSTFGDKIKGIGTAAAKWPLYFKTIPVAGAPSLANLAYTTTELKNRIAEQRRLDDQQYANKVLDKFIPRSEVSSAIERVVAAAKNNRIDTPSLSTVVEGLNTRQLGETLTQVLDELEEPEQQRLARLTGNGGDVEALRRDIRSGGKHLETIQTSLKASLPSGGTASELPRNPEMYDRFTANFGGTTLSINRNEFSDASLSALQLPEEATEMNISDIGPSKFFDAFVTKLNNRERRAILESNPDLLEELKEDEFSDWRERVKTKDPALQQALENTLRSGDTLEAREFNTKVIELLSTLLPDDKKDKKLEELADNYQFDQP